MSFPLQQKCHLSNLRYADDTTLMADSEEELKGVIMLATVRVVVVSSGKSSDTSSYSRSCSLLQIGGCKGSSMES